MSDEHDNQNGDTERLSRIRLTTNAYRVYHEPPDEPELFFLLRIIDDRDTSLREARAKERCLRNLLQQASDERQKWFEEAERFRKVAERAAIVAWLRDQARAHEEEAADLLETAAELIERGEHASGESK